MISDPHHTALVYTNKCLQTDPRVPRQHPRGGVVALFHKWKKGATTFLPPKVGSWPSVGRSSRINSALRVGNFIYFFIGGKVCNQQKWISQTYQTPFMCIKIRDPPHTPPPNLPEFVALSACLMLHAYSCVPGLLSFQLRIQAFVTPISSVTSRRKANLLPFSFTGSITALLSLALKLVIYPHTTL